MALARQDWAGAHTILSQAGSDLPPEGMLDHALALRMLGRLPDALVRLDAALALEPRHLVALLSKGALLERMGQSKAAALVYRNALACAPPDEVLPAPLRAQLDHARAATKAFGEALARRLSESVAEIKARWQGESFARFDESLRIFAGLQRPYPQEPLLLHYPRLPAIPFYDRALFPWLETLEAATPVIQAELEALLATAPEDFAPYIAFPPGAPVDQWAELNHSRRWSSFFLWRDGARQDAACALCPRTAALMDELPLMRQPGFAPTVVFSQLEPHTRIPPHTGSANHRLLCHLPLILPGPARFRVGAETRDWKMGEAWVFDDTIEHEAWNDADAARTILIIDVWNPLISEAERDLISAMMTASNAFRAEP
ncbi:MAG: aspartyl/asparaginyl beta-hydroxylase domain-containing protein [Alphaproteobacteria bacterium]|nr:aspartyl/asparaginyl beta-hydroxylase domain-containing protein [Alphaproteobacteria bacterium]